MQRLAELPGVHRRSAEISRLAALDDVVQRFESLLDRRRVIPAVDLVEVHVIGAEPAQAGVDRREYGLAGESPSVRALAHREKNLGGDHDLVAPGEFPQGSTDDLLGGAVGVAVGGIEVVDPGVHRLTYQGTRLFLREGPWMIAPIGNAESHASQANLGNLEAGV